MPKYQNKSEFYKKMTISGKRMMIPPSGVFETAEALDLNIHTDLELLKSDAKVTVAPVEPKKKIEVVNGDDYKKLETAILILKDRIDSKLNREQVKTEVDSILKSTPAVEEEELQRLAKDLLGLKNDLANAAQTVEKLNSLEDLIKNTVLRRMEVLKLAIDKVNEAVVGLEKYVYEGEWQEITMPIVVLDDEKPPEPKKRSIEDILNEAGN